MYEKVEVKYRKAKQIIQKTNTNYLSGSKMRRGDKAMLKHLDVKLKGIYTTARWGEGKWHTNES